MSKSKELDEEKTGGLDDDKTKSSRAIGSTGTTGHTYNEKMTTSQILENNKD